MPELRLPLASDALDLASTLASGQVFRWRQAGDGWVGVVGRSVWRVRFAGAALTVESTGEPVNAAAIARFFRLDVDLASLRCALRGNAPLLDAALDRFPGLRLVRQPAHDALVSFAVASANHVGRIGRSLERLAAAYGEPIAEVAGTSFWALPSWEQLAEADPVALWRDADLGYRGRVLQRLGATLAARPAGWLDGLAALPYRAAHAELTALPGIGPKIADCVLLYGLGFDEAVPVDSHVWAIARDLFTAAIPTSSLTERTYQVVGDLYRAAFPANPGWAQQYLFHWRRMTPITARRSAA
jgi:8-oxoguanine DNA-glycosylase Ogg